MKSLLRIAALALFAMPAMADVSLNGVRVLAKDDTAHIVLNVTIGIAIDPAGNHLELIQGAGQATPQK
jgi:hypothetical protein